MEERSVSGGRDKGNRKVAIVLKLTGPTTPFETLTF